MKVWDFNISDTIDSHKSRPPRTINKAEVKSQTSIGRGSRQNKYSIKHQKSEGVQYSDFTNEFENWYTYNLASDQGDKNKNTTTLNFSTSNRSHKIIYNKAPFDPRCRIRREKSKIKVFQSNWKDYWIFIKYGIQLQFSLLVYVRREFC